MRDRLLSKVLVHLIREPPGHKIMLTIRNRPKQKKKRVRQSTTKERRELHQVTKALNISNDKFRALVDSSPDSIMILGEDGVVLFINHQPPGHQEGNLKGKKLLEVIPEQSKPKFNRFLSGMFLDEKAFHIEGPSGTWWKLRTVPLEKQENGVFLSVMVVITDQTEKHNTQTKAMRNARLATVGALASTVAHEVNNPNNAILLQASWLAKLLRNFQIHVQENEEQYTNILFDDKKFLENIKKSSEFLADIIGNSRRIGNIVGNIKRMTKPNNNIFREDVCIKDVLDSALSILANQTDKYCDACFAQVERNLPKIHGNQQQLEQVFVNLILNALQSLPNRKCKVTVRAWYDEEIQKIAVIVEDEGIGIPEENIENVSLPFFTTKLDQGGTGLGLAICQSILTKHNCGLNIDSEPGRGTSIRINFPIVGQPTGEAQ